MWVDFGEENVASAALSAALSAAASAASKSSAPSASSAHFPSLAAGPAANFAAAAVAAAAGADPAARLVSREREKRAAAEVAGLMGELSGELPPCLWLMSLAQVRRIRGGDSACASCLLFCFRPRSVENRCSTHANVIMSVHLSSYCLPIFTISLPPESCIPTNPLRQELISSFSLSSPRDDVCMVGQF